MHSPIGRRTRFKPPFSHIWETNFTAPHQSIAEWKDGKGFEVTAADSRRVAILSVAISGAAVVITCATDPGPGARVGYAMVGERQRMATPYRTTFRWGLLRDSDAFVGEVAGNPNRTTASPSTSPPRKCLLPRRPAAKLPGTAVRIV